MNTSNQAINRNIHLCLSLFICGFILCSGCTPKKPKQREPWFGPTESLETVIQKINENNSRIPTLWMQGASSGGFEAWVRDDRNKEIFLNGDVTLMFRSPRDLRIRGKKPGIGQVFDVGSNADRYWMQVGGEVDTLWWGDYANASGPRPEAMPVRPDLLLQVLGVATLDTNLLEQPVPVMRFNNDAHAYMLVWNVRSADRWVALKEVWYDRETFLPQLVVLFDANGRIVLRAYLSHHESVGTEGGKVATHYQLFFPETRTKLNLKLNEAKLSHNGFPRDASFAFPGEDAASKVICIDVPTNP